ncbi:MAG: photosynthetic complex assembly protein PuhC [Beijerinckiaceae bacterium]
MSTGFIDAKDSTAAPPRAAADAPVLNTRIVIAMGLLCLSALALAAFGRITGIGVQQVPRAAVTEMRSLVFADAGRGVIEITDGENGALVQRIGTNEGSFIRTVMRGFAQDRLRSGGERATPFRLTLHANGHLIVADPVTGREVILDPFGKPNRDAFAALLRSGGSVRGAATIKAAGAAQSQGESK